MLTFRLNLFLGLIAFMIFTMGYVSVGIRWHTYRARASLYAQQEVEHTFEAARFARAAQDRGDSAESEARAVECRKLAELHEESGPREHQAPQILRELLVNQPSRAGTTLINAGSPLPNSRGNSATIGRAFEEPRTMPQARSTFSVKTLMLAVAFVAGSIAWSAHWSDCKYQAVLHQTIANAERQKRAGSTELEIDQKRRVVEWHEEMGRRFERSAWLPWPGSTTEPPRP